MHLNLFVGRCGIAFLSVIVAIDIVAIDIVAINSQGASLRVMT
ncbi:hypothetical protein [Endozoicomonas sp. SESOKO1]|nr:hypothetical protein [Endozoicomonas sp. SESOKO1]